MAALLDQMQGKTGLVDVIAVRLADRAKGLDADGQAFSELALQVLDETLALAN
jgi:hypothetical protein